MDQQKIGRFLRELRNERGITQEQLAERLSVSNRSISRWENGATMPDFDLLMQLSEFYEVEIGELLDGERRGEKTGQETLLKVADYQNAEKIVFSRRTFWMFMAGIIAMFLYLVLDLLELTAEEPYSFIGGLFLGIAWGVLISGALYSTRYMVKFRAAKLRLLRRLRGEEAHVEYIKARQRLWSPAAPSF